MSRYCIQIEWDDVPHLTDEAKKSLWDSIPVYQRDARSKGVPVLGSGVIYPVPEDRYVVEPFDIPHHWPRAFGMDVGWNKTAAIWGAWDRTADVVYLYAEHYMGQAEPSIHADAIKAKGKWIPGAIDPAAGASGQKDGAQLLEVYRQLELDLIKADNAVEAGIHKMFQRLSSGRLKVFNTCRAFLSEIRIYRRDDKGKVVKQNDHLMDAARYLVMTGMVNARQEPAFEDEMIAAEQFRFADGRHSVTGY